MGVSLATAEFLVEARQRGASFERTCTVGRQALFPGPKTTADLLERHGLLGGGREALYRRLGEKPATLEPLLEALGAREVTAIDASAYEGADVVHDLNQPVPEALHSRFSVVFDGGTLEHVFDVATALRNYLAMVEVGGRLIVHTMANNNLGHGFYQFSPELFFRVLAPENGYEIERVVLTENDLLWRRALGLMVPLEHRGPWYEVADPADVRSRIQLVNRRPTVIQVQARRVADVPVLATAPQQSDYAMQWEASPPRPAEPAVAGPGLRGAVSRRLGPHGRNSVAHDLLPQVLGAVAAPAWRRDRRERSFANARFFRRVRQPSR